MLREPYITLKGLSGMKSMIEHLGDGLDSFKARQGPPPRPPVKQNAHKMQPVGDLMGGMDGEIVDGLLAYCMANLGKDPAITKAFKDMIMVAKLAADESSMEPYRKALNYRKEQDANAEATYRHRMADYKRSCERTIENYHNCEAELQVRWKRILKSLQAAVNKNPDITTMAIADQQVFNYLNKRGFVTIRGNTIISIDHSRLENSSQAFKNETIQKIVSIVADVEARCILTGMKELLDKGKPKVQILPPAVVSGQEEL